MLASNSGKVKFFLLTWTIEMRAAEGIYMGIRANEKLGFLALDKWKVGRCRGNAKGVDGAWKRMPTKMRSVAPRYSSRPLTIVTHPSTSRPVEPSSLRRWTNVPQTAFLGTGPFPIGPSATSLND